MMNSSPRDRYASGAVRRRSLNYQLAQCGLRFLWARWFWLVSLCVLLLVNPTSACNTSGPEITSDATTINVTMSPVIVQAGANDAVIDGKLANDPNLEGRQTKPAILRYRPYPGGLVIPDPTVESAANAFLFAEVYSGLTKPSHLDLDQIEPDLAESYAVSDDSLEYTFRLRDGAKFSDGTPVSVHDVKWSWERALRPETRSARAAEVLGMIVGARAVSDGLTDELAGFTAVDDATFAVRLDRPHADFLWLLADPVASVLKRSNAEQWATEVDWATGYFPRQLQELPVGTGPFRVSALDPLTGEVVLSPNFHHWGSPPALDFVIYDFYDGFGDVMHDWVEGDYDTDIAPSVFCDSYSTFGDYTANGVPVALVASESSPQVSYMAFNTAIAPFDDVEFRRALVASASPASYEIEPYLDYPETPAAGLLPPGFPAHTERDVAAVGEREDAVRNLQKSSYSGSPNRLEIRFIPEDYELARDDLVNLSANWREWLGLDAGFTELPDSRQMTAFHHNLREGTLQMRYMKLRPRYPSPHAILGAIPNLFGPDAQSPETVELQQMLDDASAEQDSVRRLAMYKDIEQHILDRALVLPMFWDEGGRCNQIQEWIEEFRVPKWGGSLFNNVVIDTEHPAYPNRTVGN